MITDFLFGDQLMSEFSVFALLKTKGEEDCLYTVFDGIKYLLTFDLKFRINYKYIY